MRKFLLLTLFFASSSAFSTVISSENSINYVGEKATVCGKIVQIANIGGDTFINIDRPHPHQKFYFYLASGKLSNEGYLFKSVCGTGLVEAHKGKFQIKIQSPNQLKKM